MVPVEIALGDVPSSKVDSLVNPTIEVPLAETVAAKATSNMKIVLATTISTVVTLLTPQLLQVMIIRIQQSIFHILIEVLPAHRKYRIQNFIIEMCKYSILPL